MDRNPDKYFVLHGRKPPVRDKDAGYLTNSQRTLSTRNLSQTSTYRPDSRSTVRSSLGWTEKQSLLDTGQSLMGGYPPDNPYSEIQEDLRAKNSELSLDLRSLNSSLNKSLNKSVTFSEHINAYSKTRDEDEASLDDTFEDELRRLIANDTHENDGYMYEQNFAGKAKGMETSQWYTEPVHLARETEYPIFESLGAREHTVSSVRRTTGMLGTEMAQKKVASSISLDQEVKKYFPVTFGEVPAVMQTLTPAPPLDGATQNALDRTSRSVASDVGHRRSTAQSRPFSASRKPLSASSRLQNQDNRRSTSRTSSRQRNGFPTNGMSLRLSHDMATPDPQSKAVKDYNYLKASRQFVEEERSASPFEYELAKLRMERLRLEEQRILETKRQEELERIRGPTPKWYELKTPKFTYEHTKNNQLNNSRKDWQGLYDYRTKLLAASQEFAKSAT